MGKFYILTQILQGNALFTGKIYTARKIFTRPPVATVVKNFKYVNPMQVHSLIVLIFQEIFPRCFLLESCWSAFWDISKLMPCLLTVTTEGGVSVLFTAVKIFPLLVLTPRRWTLRSWIISCTARGINKSRGEVLNGRQRH